MAEILDGKALATKIKKEVKAEVKRLRSTGIDVGLGVLRVGDVPASKQYYMAILRNCERMGVIPYRMELPAEASIGEILNVVSAVNVDERVHGLLVLFPLPKRINPRRVVNEITPEKDVDGLGYLSIGRLAADESTFQIFDQAGSKNIFANGAPPRVSGFLPCTPFGVIRLLEHHKVKVKGMHAVVVGKSLAVGKPLSQMLLAKEATVTVCHRETKDLAAMTRQADLVCTAVGVPGLIKAGMIKKGAVVVDIGINVLPGGKIVGDVDYDNVAKKASYITPVPGGVGPVTIAMLLENTVRSAGMNALNKDPLVMGG